MLAVVGQFLDGLADVVQRQVLILLLEAGQDVRLPAPRQLLEGGHIQVAVVEKRFQARHVVGQETAVLTDAVAAHGRHARFHVLLQKRQGAALRLGVVQIAFADPLHQPGIVVVLGVPFVHAVEQRVALMHRHHGPLREDVQMGVGDNGGDLDDAVIGRVQPGHFQVDPDQVVS